MKTYSLDHTLPSLPVPELAASCEAVLELVQPLVDEAAFAATRAAVRELAAPGGAGERLQALLLEHKATLPGNASWLRPLWDDMYLAWREPLPIAMNYCFRFDADRWGGVRALPRLAKALAETACLLRDGALPPEPCRAGGLSMDQARSCFYTRIPCNGSDALVRTDLAGPLTAAVACKGRWFIVPLTAADGTLADEQALAQAFAAVRQQAAAEPGDAPPVGAMTASPRPEAAALRAALQERTQNRLSLAELEKSLFVICLDPPHDSDDSFMHSLLCGPAGSPAGSRWFDKSLQIVSSENGGLGANFEHAGCDAAIWLYLLGLCDKGITRECGEDAGMEPGAGADAPRSGAGSDAVVRFLCWDVQDALLAGLGEAALDFAARAAGMDLRCRDFAEYSREGLKKLGTSPDAFLQIAFQAAQYRIFGRLRSSYEAVAVRGFAQGRTECARGSTAEAAAFARLLRKKGPPQETLRHYRLAENAHKARLGRSQKGLGAERHMTGLAAMHTLHAQRLGLGVLPALFRDPGWLTVKHDALSTSGIGAPFIRFFGFGPVVRDGYGIGYAPGPDATGLVVTSFRNKAEPPELFLAAFAESAQEAAQVLIQDLPEG